MFVGLVGMGGVGSYNNCSGVLCGQGCNGNGCAATCGDVSDLNASYGCGSQCVTGDALEVYSPDYKGCAEYCTAHNCGQMCAGEKCAQRSIGDYSGQHCTGPYCKSSSGVKCCAFY